MKGRRMLCCVLAICLVLTGCSGMSGKKQHTATFLDLFDTVTTVLHYGGTQEEFDRQAQSIRTELEFYHQLFDIYNDYPGVNNLKTVNDQAGIAPVKVDRAIIDLLIDCRNYYDLTGGMVDVTMGSVLRLWHEARTAGLADQENAYLPDRAALEEAADHTGFDSILIDEAASTVYLADSEMRLDVGAIAKGWATQRVADNAPDGYLISVGGNVCATGAKTHNGDAWVVAIQHPDGEGYLHTIGVTGGCVVTSGDYQRTYIVDDKQYHHIIDPNTLMPSTYWQSVTVVCVNSALADALSTALFLLPLEQGQALAQSCGADALWVDPQGQEYHTPGFETLIRS